MRAHRFLLRKRFFFFPENEAMRAASDRRKYIDFPGIILTAFRLIVSIRLSRSRYLAAAAFLLLRDRAWMPSTTSTIARTTSRMAMIART